MEPASGQVLKEAAEHQELSFSSHWWYVFVQPKISTMCTFAPPVIDLLCVLVGDPEWLMANKVQKCVDGHLMCLLCGKKFTQKGSLKRHMREVHTAPTRYRCPICNSTFLNRAFNMHIRQNHSSWTDVDYERYRDDQALE